jgi:predicted ATPase/DNA-binding SARP family transcriptional activator
MRFGILGTTEVRLPDGTSVAVGGARVRSLLALLLLDPGRLVTVDRLIDGLYGEDAPADAAHALQSQVSRLRRSLGGARGHGALVEFQPAGYRLAVDPEDVDVHRFERLAREGRHASASGDHRTAAELLGDALALWRGPALVDVSDAPFAKAQAARLEEERVSLVEERAESVLALGEHRKILSDLQGLVSSQPLREKARGLLMRALYHGGRQAEALRVYEDGRAILAEELGADPSPELAAVHLAILRADPSIAQPQQPRPRARPQPAGGDRDDQASVPSRSPIPPSPTAPPVPLTTFIGREEDLRKVRKLLAEHRLVTLLGPGGTGKTRLAVEVASRSTDDEVCFADLARLSAPGEVPDAFLDALGLRDGGLLSPSPERDQAADPVRRLASAVGERRLLLVADNCEHVIDEAATVLHRLLASCPALRVLATSREALGITGESLHRLPPLALPPDGTPAARMPEYPAVRLFADRAAAVQAGFRVDEDNAEPVLRICAALDGLPLAIELAAARLGSLPVAEIAARLDDRFRLLSRGSRTAAPRHQTLRAVVRWSWDLLAEEEQTLARRLSVFVGGFREDAARQVCGLSREALDDPLAGLVDKSLVHMDGDRYRMLDTVRAFCAERLGDSGEEERLRRAHASYFCDFAQEADPRLRGGEQLEWLSLLAAEHGNLHAALRWSVGADPALALALVAALSWYWWLRGRIEGARLAARLLEAIGASPPSGMDEEYVLCVATASLGGMLDPDPMGHVERATSILYGIARPLRRQAILMLWAALAGPPPPEAADTMKRQVGTHPWAVALSRLGEGFQLWFGGATDATEPAFTDALTGFRTVGDRWGTAISLDLLSQLAEQRGDTAACRALVDEALELAAPLGAPEDMADLLVRRANGLLLAGEYDAAHADYAQAEGLARQGGAREQLAAAHAGFGEVARVQGDLDAAREHYQAALNEIPGDRFLRHWTRTRALCGLARVALAESDTNGARSLYRRALAIAVDHGHSVRIAAALAGLAGADVQDGNGEQAALLLGAAAALSDGALPPEAIDVPVQARRLIGDDAYEAAYEQGKALPRDDALRLAATPETTPTSRADQAAEAD